MKARSATAAESRLIIRDDLPGYGPKLSELQRINGTVIDKPFVFFVGGNGCGKTTLLHMIRQSMGLRGTRFGDLPRRMEFSFPETLKDAGNDIGRFADGVPSEDSTRRPGIVDLKALGWHGQLCYLLDTRDSTTRAGATQFSGHDFGLHVAQIMQSQSSSHGQLLLNEMFQAGLFAVSGVMPKHVKSSMADAISGRYANTALDPLKTIIKAHLGGKTNERWLMIDEPETAVETSTFINFMCSVIAAAEFGSLRVFCATHSPYVALGLARHPKVQVIEVEPGYINEIETVLGIIRQPDQVDAIGRKMNDRAKAMAAADEPKSKRSVSIRSGSKIEAAAGRKR